MKYSDLIHENNRIRALLHPANKEYYEGMLVYIRSSNIDQQKAEELLFEILQHMLDAQSKGRSAKEAFGNDPKAYCHELLEQLPKPRWAEKLSNFALIMWCSLTFTLLLPAMRGVGWLLSGMASTDASEIQLSSILIHMALSMAIIVLFLRALKKSSFHHEKGSFNWLLFAGFSGFIAISVLVGLYMKDRLPVLAIHPGMSLLLFVLGVAGIKVIFLRGSSLAKK